MGPTRLFRICQVRLPGFGLALKSSLIWHVIKSRGSIYQLFNEVLAQLYE